MAGDQKKVRDQPPAGKAADAAPAADETAPVAPVNWRAPGRLWQMPVIAASTVLIGVGIAVSINARPQHDFNGALDQVEQFIQNGELVAASRQLNEVIGPYLDDADPLQRARFHAAVADWISASQTAEGINIASNNERILAQYAKAEELGLTLSARRIERCAQLRLLAGDLPGARDRLAQLDALDEHAPDPEVRGARNRIFRALAEETLRRPGQSHDALMDALRDFRADGKLGLDDEMWAVARQTELRLEGDLIMQAVDHLLVEMRRLETRAEDDQTPAAGASLGELYQLLGRAYYELGDFDAATVHLDRAMALLAGAEPARGEALVLRGQIAVAEGRLDEAYESFDHVARDFTGTPSHLKGLLGRAEVASVLGNHDAARADYDRVVEGLVKNSDRRDITPQHVATSLCDRYDAAVATGRVRLALDYARIAERLFEPAHVPPEVLLRIASASRQLAEELLASGTTDAAEEPGEHGHEAHTPAAPREVSAAARYEANVYYETAGDYAIRHARSVANLPGAEQEWSASLWLAADCYDLGGRYEHAIENFREYVASHSLDDSRRAEALHRLGIAQLAQMNAEAAAESFEQVISEYPRSPYASRSHVPLARAYLVLQRPRDAERELSEVLAGSSLVTPEARDYRDALVELGQLHYEAGNYDRAIERLSEAADRYPDDPEIGQVLFRLADSYRASAVQSAEELSRSTALSPSEAQRLSSRNQSHLATAMELFGRVESVMSRRSAAHEGALDRQVHRQAALARADCAFMLGRYAEAIELYDAAARTYSAHHSSMYALVQIVNAYVELGEMEKAATAHHRALVRLRQLPDETFAAPDALMERSAWERWLEHSPVGLTRTANAEASD